MYIIAIAFYDLRARRLLPFSQSLVTGWRVGALSQITLKLYRFIMSFYCHTCFKCTVIKISYLLLKELFKLQWYKWPSCLVEPNSHASLQSLLTRCSTGETGLAWCPDCHPGQSGQLPSPSPFHHHYFITATPQHHHHHYHYHRWQQRFCHVTFGSLGSNVTG